MRKELPDEYFSQSYNDTLGRCYEILAKYSNADVYDMSVDTYRDMNGQLGARSVINFQYYADSERIRQLKKTIEKSRKSINKEIKKLKKSHKDADDRESIYMTYDIAVIDGELLGLLKILEVLENLEKDAEQDEEDLHSKMFADSILGSHSKIK